MFGGSNANGDEDGNGDERVMETNEDRLCRAEILLGLGMEQEGKQEAIKGST